MGQQREFQFFGLMEPPMAVPTQVIAFIKSYRQACRVALRLARVKRTLRTLSEMGGFTYQHVSDWFNKDDARTRRSMPAECVARFEVIVGNTVVSQWLAAQAGLTVAEEMQANIVAARAGQSFEDEADFDLLAERMAA